MKTLLLLSLFFTALIGRSQDWCHAGSTWTYNYYSMAGGGYERYIYEKDTAVQSQACQKLTATRIIQHYPNYNLDTVMHETRYTFSRSDTVFLWRTDAFFPVYFFNAVVGDTITYHNPRAYCGDSVIRQVIDSTGLMTMNSISLRYYVARGIDSFGAFPSTGTVRVIERIGAVDNLIDPFFICMVDGESYFLRCYADDSFSVYQTQPSVACDYIYSSIDVPETPLNYYPNPAVDVIHLNNESQLQYALYDVAGKKLNQGILQANGSLDVARLPQGAYFLRAEKVIADKHSPDLQSRIIRIIKQ